MSGKHRGRGRNGRPLVFLSVGQPEPSWPNVIATTLRLWLERRGRIQRGRATRPESRLTRQTIRLALLIAGQRRAYLRDAWRADLYADEGRRLFSMAPVAAQRWIRGGSDQLPAYQRPGRSSMPTSRCGVGVTCMDEGRNRLAVSRPHCYDPLQSRCVRPRSKCRFSCRGRRRPRCRTSLATSAAQNGTSRGEIQSGGDSSFPIARVTHAAEREPQIGIGPSGSTC